MVIITEIKECARNKERVNLYADGEFLMALYVDTAIANHLKKGVALSDDMVEELRRQDGEKYAFGIAMEYLSHKMRTEREVTRRLKAKEFDEETIRFAVEKLKEYGYINDESYAQMYAQELMARFGRKVAVQKLMERGIPRSMAEEAAGACCQPEEVLDGLIETLRQRYREDEPAKQKQKIIRALMGKGFDYEDIKSALLRNEA